MYDFDEISFCKNIERNFPYQKLISQDSNAPYIDFVIVVIAFDKFWRDIERSSTEGFRLTVELIDHPKSKILAIP